MPKISVCMATRNGEKYVREQLESILPQLGRDDELVVSDDSSTDRTVDIVRGVADSRIRLYCNNTFSSPTLNFSHAMSMATGEIIFLADQDDVWLPHKVQVTIGKMLELEGVHGSEIPLLVHTDAKVVGENLEPVAESLWRYQNTDSAKGSTLNRLLVQNTVSGCTVAINRALCRIALPIPREAVMHDWWLALVAAVFGRIGHVSQPTLLYRQHGRNDTGAQQWEALERLFSIREIRQAIVRIEKQAEVFLDCFGDRLSADDREMIGVFASLEEKGYFAKRYYIMKYGFFHAGMLRNIARILFV